MENLQAIQSQLSALNLTEDGSVARAGDPEKKEKKDNKMSSEIEQRAAETSLFISKQCQSRIGYNEMLLGFLNDHPMASREYLKTNFYPLYKLALQNRWSEPKFINFVQILIKNNIFYYKEIEKRLQVGEFDEVFLILKTAVNGVAGGSISTNSSFERERGFLLEMLRNIKSFRSYVLEGIQNKKYITYSVQPTPANLQLPESNRKKTFSIDFNKIKLLEIDSFGARIEEVVEKINSSLKGEGERKEVLERLQSLRKKIIPILSLIDANFCKKINAFFTEAQGSAEKNISAILTAYTELKSHIQILRNAIKPLVVELREMEDLSRKIEQIKNLHKIFESHKYTSKQEILVSIKEFLEQENNSEARKLLKELSEIENFSVIMLEDMRQSVKERCQWTLEFLKEQYQSLNKAIGQFNDGFRAYRIKAVQSKTASVYSSSSVTQTETISVVAQKGRDWMLQLPPLETTHSNVLTSVERTRAEVEQERALNQEKVRGYYQTLLQAEHQTREEQVKKSCLNKNITSQFQALYKGSFSHKDLERLVAALKEQGEVVSINYPGSGSSHCTLSIQGSLNVLEDFQGSITFVEKAGSWDMQAKERRRRGNDRLPPHLLIGIQQAFQRAGYTERALGLTQDNTKPIESSSTMSSHSTTSSPAVPFLPGYALTQNAAPERTGRASPAASQPDSKIAGEQALTEVAEEGNDSAVGLLQQSLEGTSQALPAVPINPPVAKKAVEKTRKNKNK